MIRTGLLLGVTWVALTGDLSVANVAFGVLLGVLAVRVARPLGPYPVFARVRPFKAHAQHIARANRKHKGQRA